MAPAFRDARPGTGARQVTATNAGITQSNLLYGATAQTACTILNWITPTTRNGSARPATGPPLRPTHWLLQLAARSGWHKSPLSLELSGLATEFPRCLAARPKHL